MNVAKCKFDPNEIIIIYQGEFKVGLKKKIYDNTIKGNVTVTSSNFS